MVNKIKILMFTANYAPTIGGTEHQVRLLSEYFVRQGHNVYILTRPYPGYPKKTIEEGVVVIRSLNSGRLLNPFIYFDYIKIVKGVDPDIIHVYETSHPGFIATLLNPIVKKPIVVNSRGADLQTDKELGYGVRLKSTGRFLVKFVLRRCSAHLLVSKSMFGDALRAGSDAKKIKVIHNAAPNALPIFDEKKIKNTLEKFNIPVSKNIILAISRLVPKKGIEYLVKAMPEILEKHPDTILVIAGEGPEKDRLLNLIQRLKLEKYISTIGNILGNEKYAIIQACTIFCTPYIKEGMPNSLFEPMLYGKAIVASGVDGILEMIDDGINGFLTSPRDEESLSEKICKLIESERLRQQLGNSAKSKVIANFNIEKIGKEYIDNYKDVISRNKLRI